MPQSRCCWPAGRRRRTRWARRRVLARQDCLKCLDALHGLNQQLLFDLDRQLGKQARVEAAPHLQARYRSTPAARIRCTQHVGGSA